MIYKLSQTHLRAADSEGMRFICMNATGEYFLAQADSLPEGIDSEQEYDDDQENIITLELEWQQPQSGSDE